MCDPKFKIFSRYKIEGNFRNASEGNLEADLFLNQAATDYGIKERETFTLVSLFYKNHRKNGISKPSKAIITIAPKISSKIP